MYSLIVVDYNSLEKTIEYIQLCRQFLGRKGSAHVVIVDNGTLEHPLQLLADHFGKSELLNSPEIEQPIYSFKAEDQQILYCHSGANLGYAKGNNLGVKIARNVWNDPFYIISNNDLVLSKTLDLSIIDHLFETNHQIGVIGPRVITPAGEQQSPRRWQSVFQRLIANYWVSACGGLLGRTKRQQLWSKYCNDTGY
jgi:GT2 family glycosyltransferase